MSTFTIAPIEDEAPAPDELEDLNTWFRGHDGLDGTVELQMRPPAPGEMGGMADAVMVTAAAIPVARAFFGWLEARIKTHRVAIQLRSDFLGRTLDIKLDQGQDAAELLPALQAFFAGTPDEDV